MLYLDVSPNAIHFSKNRVYAVLSSNKLPVSPAIAAVYKIELQPGTWFTDGATIKFKWGIGDEAVEFTMFGTSLPGLDNAYYYLTTAFVSEATAYADATPHFNANYYLNRDWIIVASPTEITFTARNKGSAYNLDWTTTDANVILSQVTAGADAFTPENYTVLADVYIQENYDPVLNANPYTRVKSIQHRPSENNTVEFDFKELLHPYLGTAQPVLGETPTLCHQINKRWFIRFTEHYGTIPVGQKVIRVPNSPTGFFRVIKGGLSHRDERAALGYYSDVIAAYFQNEGQLLTWRNFARYVTPNQPEWLYLLHGPASAAEVYVKCKVYYTDGTDLTYTAHAVLTGEFNNNVWRYPVGYNQIDVGGQDPSKEVARYDVWIENDQGTQLAGLIRFYLEIPHHYERYLVYENSLGGYDTLRIYGGHKGGVKVESGQFEKMVPYNFSADSYEAVGNYNTQYSEEFDASTGALKSESELKQLTELLISEHVFIYDPLANTITTTPIALVRDSFSLVEDDNTAYALNFKYRNAFNESQFSKLSFI